MASQRYFQDLGDRTGSAGSPEARIDDEPANGRSRMRLAAFAVAILMVVCTGWLASRDVRELSTEAMIPPTQAVALANQLPSSTATIPNLSRGTAIPLPGFDQVGNAFSPALSADMKTIVFAQFLESSTGYDLYIATRENVDDPFETPVLISGCQSVECDAYPTLSPDMLELIFVRSDNDPHLLRSVRPTIHDEFGAAEPCGTLCDPESEEAVTTPQLIAGGTQLFYGCRRLDPIGRRLGIATRNAQDEFEPAHRLISTHTLPMMFLSTDLLRAYSSGPGGIHLAIRQSTSHSFGNGLIWADSAVAGEVEGPLWVSPEEDTAVYCSAGPGKKPGEARRLWLWKSTGNGGLTSVGRK